MLPPVSTVFSPHLDRWLSPQGLDPLKAFLKFTLVRSATAPSYNMAVITTSIKSNKSSFPTRPYSLHSTSGVIISYFDCCIVPLYSAYLCVCVTMLLSVCCYYCFSDCRIYLFSSLAASVFNKHTRYLLVRWCRRRRV